MEVASSSKMLARFYPLHGVTSQKMVFFVVMTMRTKNLMSAVMMKTHIYYIHFVVCCFLITGGSIWKPPPMHPYTQGMPDELVEGEEKEPRKGSLSNT
jgi:hypothetical protein